MHLSVVIPAYNEEKRIGKTLSTIRDYFESQNYDYEVIVVDDGSEDETVLESEKSKLASEDKLKVIKNGINKGKGFSVKNGILKSIGEHVLVCDADSSTPIEEIEKLSGYLEDGYDIAIGSRSINGSDVRVKQPWYRERMGKIFNFFVKSMLMKDFNDTQCGFKVFKGDTLRSIAKELKINGFCFDVEVLYLAKKRGYKVKEIGVAWDNSRDSRVKVIGSSANMFFDLFKIKKIYR